MKAASAGSKFQSPTLKAIGSQNQSFNGKKEKDSKDLSAQQSGKAKKSNDSEFLDLKKALVPQMFSKRFSKQQYLDEVHKPRFLKGSALFFNQPYLEVFTRTPWYAIPLVWGPIAGLHLFGAIKNFSDNYSSLTLLSILFLTGMFAWTLLEYVFHRFLFHMERILPSHQTAYCLHFLLHGVHHFLPMDRMRLVMPPVMFATLSVGPYFLFSHLLGHKYFDPIYSGVVVAYIFYDMAHYFFHHGLSKLNVVNQMKSYHMAHHYKDYNKGYGVTSILWDLVFHTTFDYSSISFNFNKY